MSTTYPNARHLWAEMRDGLAFKVAQYRALAAIPPTPVREYIKAAIRLTYGVRPPPAEEYSGASPGGPNPPAAPQLT